MTCSTCGEELVESEVNVCGLCVPTPSGGNRPRGIRSHEDAVLAALDAWDQNGNPAMAGDLRADILNAVRVWALGCRAAPTDPPTPSGGDETRDELVKRLRDNAEAWRNMWNPPAKASAKAALSDQAADEIERLRAEVAALRAEGHDRLVPLWVIEMVLPWADEYASWGEPRERESVEILRSLLRESDRG